MLLMVHSFYYILITNHNELTPFHPKNPFFPSFGVKNDNIRQLSPIQKIYFFKMNEQRHAKRTQQNLFLFQETILFFKKLSMIPILNNRKIVNSHCHITVRRLTMLVTWCTRKSGIPALMRMCEIRMERCDCLIMVG